MIPLRLGTRGSLLATTQSQWVADRLTEATGRTVELVIIKTRGDKVQDRPLAQVGGKGLFTKELEDALLSGAVDLAVHSMKDMPTDAPEGLLFGAIPDREDPRDVLIGATLDALPAGAVVGTGSARRHAQLAALRPDLQIEGIRGNVDTRIQKLHSGAYQAIVLAAAGVHRLGRQAEIRDYLAADRFVPAVGQGALAVQCREVDLPTRALLERIHDVATATCVAAERAFLTRISGGCSVPAACHAEVRDGELFARAFFKRPDGTIQRAEDSSSLADPEHLGTRLAEAVLG